MENSLKVGQTYKEIIDIKRKKRFIKIEKENNKTVYHTKIMMDIHKLGIVNVKKINFVCHLENYIIKWKFKKFAYIL